MLKKKKNCLKKKKKKGGGMTYARLPQHGSRVAGLDFILGCLFLSIPGPSYSSGG
jgi:hypothetical protein